MLTKPHGAVPSPNPASLSGFQTLPSRGLGQRRTSVGSAAACASGRVPASSSSYYRGTYHSNSGVTTSASGAVDHVISRCDYENVDMLSSMVPRRDPVGIRGSISDVTPETDVVHRAARCRIYQQQQPQPHPLPSKMTNDAGAIEYGNLGSRSLGRSLQDLPDTNV